MTSSRIQVAHGRSIDPLAPTEDEIFIEDIAHALSNQCRFSGHVKTFYSVAEHVVRASLLVPEKFAFEALNHDDTEAYIVDIPRPLKQDPDFGEAYRKYETALDTVIRRKFELPPEMSPEVKVADDIMLATEVRDLLIWTDSDEEYEKLWASWLPYPATDERITEPLTPDEARIAFMARFHILDLRKEKKVVATTSA